ncbi:hypothetical protein V9948_002713 [Providencia rettgeri]|nr:hypothetical protein [Providencia rettgeri]
MLRLISKIGIGNNSVSRMSHDVTPKVGNSAPTANHQSKLKGENYV